MLTNTHIPTLILTIVISLTAIGVLTTVEQKDVQIDIATIETPPDEVVGASAQDANRAWWNLLGYVIDRLNGTTSPSPNAATEP